jgi:hypothetical protein
MPTPAASAARGEPGGSGTRRPRGVGDADLARVGRVVAEEDVGQRRLAGAVLAQQRQDLARAEVEVDRVVSEQAAEALGDAGEPQQDGARPRCRRLAHANDPAGA